MLSRQLSILRLRRYQEECRAQSMNACDPQTKHELAELENAFRRLAADYEMAETFEAE